MIVGEHPRMYKMYLQKKEYILKMVCGHFIVYISLQHFVYICLVCWILPRLVGIQPVLEKSENSLCYVSK